MFEKVDGVWQYKPSLNITNPVKIFGYGVTSEEGAEKQIKKKVAEQSSTKSADKSTVDA